MNRIKALVARIPAPVKEQAVKVARTFGSAFVGAALVLIPGVMAAPNFSTARAALVALVLASGAAAFRAALPVAKVALLASVRYFLVR